MWGEGINEDNFDAFVWRGAAAIAERLWTTEERLLCPATHCPGIKDADGFGPGNATRYWLVPDGPSGNYARFADQLCRMSRRGARVGPTAPGYCPSDSGATAERRAQAVLRQLQIENARLREENAALRAHAALKSDDRGCKALNRFETPLHKLWRGSTRACGPHAHACTHT